MNFLKWKSKNSFTLPVGDDFADLGTLFARAAELRGAWRDCTIEARREERALAYWAEWEKIAATLQNDRTREAPPHAPAAPFKWTTREGCAVTSSCVRMETVCCCVALAEFCNARKERKKESEWLFKAWRETRIWWNYPNYCFPPSLKEDYLSARACKLLVVDEEGARRNFLWLAVVERLVDDSMRAATLTDPENAPTYSDLVSEGEMVAEGLVQILCWQKLEGLDADSLALLAKRFLETAKRMAPGAPGETVLEIAIMRNEGRPIHGRSNFESLIKEARRDEENNDPRKI